MVEYWIVLGFVAAISAAGFQIYQKHLANDISSIKIAHQSNLISVPLVLFLVPFVSGNFFVPKLAFVASIITGTISGASYWLLAKAYKTEDLSTIAPLRGISPVAVAIVEPVFFPKGYSIFMIIAAVVSGLGVYTILIEGDLLSPVRGLTRTGVQLGLISTLILPINILINRYSLTALGAKPDIYAVYFLLFTAVSTAIISAILGGKKELFETIMPTRETIPLGFLRGTLIASGLGGLYLATGAKVAILLQFGILITVIFGRKILDESYFYYRVTGAIAIIVGSAIVSIMG